jgi:hypothetical protein
MSEMWSTDKQLDYTCKYLKLKSEAVIFENSI